MTIWLGLPLLGMMARRESESEEDRAGALDVENGTWFVSNANQILNKKMPPLRTKRDR